MKGKYIFIVLLIALLVYTVYKMMQFETYIRDERQVKLYVEDESKPLLNKLQDEDLRDCALNSDYYFTTNGNYFKGLTVKYLDDEKQLVWEDVLIKGVNLGVAVPGKFPAEFSLSFDEYLRWLKMIGEMNANVIRLYTILPPEFYDAFSYYNLHHNDKPLFIMQGVWTEVPASENYFDPAFIREFEKEIIDAVDVIHGKTVLKEKPGKASGVYSSNVSKYVISILLGREWEPGSVYRTNEVNTISQYNGDFVNMNNGNAMEAWLARMMDFTVLYETQHYRFQHPVSFVNWLPLDPMYHNTEIIENSKVREYDNDLESIDFSKFHPTDLFFPGIYAAYHVYPYYPDFICLQESYIRAKGPDSAQSSYYHYLKDLKLHTPGMPLVIAEYGLPSSRGNSHFAPNGFHQGGHSEKDQADLSLVLTRDIIHSGCAGAVYFEWIDEWFKHNWLVMDFEQPADDRQLWHNMENPEENFGILAMENKIRVIDGENDDWPGFRKDKISIACDADASYFYIASSLPDFDLAENNLYFAINTYDQTKGDHKLPFTDKTFEQGFEFLLEFRSTDSALILVDEPYSVFTDIYNDYIPVYASRENSNGKFIHQLLMTNRGRVSLTGKHTDPIILDRSPLVFGRSSNPATSNADWYLNSKNGFMEVRLDWHLLNVSDPAKKFVLDDKPETREIEYSKTDNFEIFAFITGKNNEEILQFPSSSPYSFTWDEWEKPQYSERIKPLYYTLKDYFKGLEVPGNRPGEDLPSTESFRITEFFNGKDGAISISFDNASYSQYQYALPILKKYRLKAGFAVVPGLLSDVPGSHEFENDVPLKRMSMREFKELAVNHDISCQLTGREMIGKDQLLDLNERLETNIQTLHSPGLPPKQTLPAPVIFARVMPGNEIQKASFDGINYTVIKSNVSQVRLDSILSVQKNQWTIVCYRHLYENSAEIPHQLDLKNIENKFLQKSVFDQQVRLLRNSNYWISSETDVFKYRKEKAESIIKSEKYQDMIFLRILNRLDQEVYDHPLTVEMKLKAVRIHVDGSETDGFYYRSDGVFLINALPNKEITIEILE